MHVHTGQFAKGQTEGDLQVGWIKAILLATKNNQIKANDTFSESQHGVCQPDGILISVGHLAESFASFFPSFCFNGHTDSDMIFQHKKSQKELDRVQNFH